MEKSRLFSFPNPDAHVVFALAFVEENLRGAAGAFFQWVARGECMELGGSRVRHAFECAQDAVRWERFRQEMLETLPGQPHEPMSVRVARARLLKDWGMPEEEKSLEHLEMMFERLSIAAGAGVRDSPPKSTTAEETRRVLHALRHVRESY